jgi:hypothetical protein
MAMRKGRARRAPVERSALGIVRAASVPMHERAQRAYSSLESWVARAG